MDEYGFFAAALGGLELFEFASRRSGRTMRMIARATNNDVIITTHQKEASRIRNLLREAGKTTSVFTRRNYEAEYNVQKAGGQTLFDHLFQAELARASLRSGAIDLEEMQRKWSLVWEPTPESDLDADFRTWKEHPVFQGRRMR